MSPILAPVVTVDGPSGTGKGTLSQRLARRLDWHLLDSGAMYRVLAYAALQDEITLDNKAALASLATGLQLMFAPPNFRGGHVTVRLDEEDVSDAIRTETCGKAASRIAAYPEVREALLARQKAFRRAPGLVADGRDMGTVVFPDALVKVYLTASQDERAKRRYKQLKEKGVSVNLARLLEGIAERDRRDTQRGVSPLKPASDAVVIDTTDLEIEVVESRVMGLMDQLPRGSAAPLLSTR